MFGPLNFILHQIFSIASLSSGELLIGTCIYTVSAILGVILVMLNYVILFIRYF